VSYGDLNLRVRVPSSPLKLQQDAIGKGAHHYLLSNPFTNQADRSSLVFYTSMAEHGRYDIEYVGASRHTKYTQHSTRPNMHLDGHMVVLCILGARLTRAETTVAV
jgi:hypothetical protein